MNERRIRATLIAITLCAVVCVGCISRNNEGTNTQTDNFVVRFVSLEYGDCSVLNFTNGIVGIIDAGDGSETSNRAIEESISETGEDDIDFLILSTPQSENAGGVSSIAEHHFIRRAFVPYVGENEESFPVFAQALDVLERSGTAVTVTKMLMRLNFDKGYLMFLSPFSANGEGEIYDGIDGLRNDENPSVNDVEDLSSAEYVCYDGVRFLFEGNCTASAEENILFRYKSGLYDGKNNENREPVSFKNIEFLKVAKQGTNACGSDFLETVNPDNAVITVSRTSGKDVPDPALINRIVSVNRDVRILRSDVFGNVSVFVQNGGYRVETDLLRDD